MDKKDRKLYDSLFKDGDLSEDDFKNGDTSRLKTVLTDKIEDISDIADAIKIAEDKGLSWEKAMIALEISQETDLSYDIALEGIKAFPFVGVVNGGYVLFHESAVYSLRGRGYSPEEIGEMDFPTSLVSGAKGIQGSFLKIYDVEMGKGTLRICTTGNFDADFDEDSCCSSVIDARGFFSHKEVPLSRKTERSLEGLCNRNDTVKFILEGGHERDTPEKSSHYHEHIASQIESAANYEAK